MTTIGDFHLHGFDVSHWQAGNINFAAGGRVFCHIKATEGSGYVDPTFAAKRDDAHAEGMVLVGLYHFAKPSQSSAHAQADHLLQTVGVRRPGEVLVLDFEDAWDEAWAVEFIQRCQAAGATVIFYSYRAMLAAHGHDAIKATGAPLWIAAYSSSPAKADVPGWPWTFWQHTNGQTAADGPYDCSVFHTNNLDELAALAGAPHQGDDMPLNAADLQQIRDLFTVEGHDSIIDNFHRLANLEAVASRDIDVLKPMVQEVLDDLKADPGHGAGAGDVDPATAAAAIATELVKRLEN